MSFVLLVVGILLAVVGFLTMGFGIPNKEFSFGSTLILTGTVSLCAGFLLIGVAFVLRELRRIARVLEGQGMTAGPAKARVRSAELPEARLPPATRAAPAPESFPHDYAPRDAAASVPHAAPPYAPSTQEHDATRDVTQNAPPDLPPWASEMRRPPAANASSPAAKPGVPPHGVPQGGPQAATREVAIGHHQPRAPQIAPEPFDEPFDEPFELTPPQPEPAVPPKPSLASRFGFPSRREGSEAPTERKRLMLERNGRSLMPSPSSGEAAPRMQDAEGAYADETRAPHARPTAPRGRELNDMPHEQPNTAGHAEAHSPSDLRHSESLPEREISAPAAPPPPRDPDFEEMWPAPKRTQQARSFGASRGPRAEESASEDFHGGEAAAARDERHVDLDVAPDLEAPVHAVSVLKSGVVDGMAYSLYSDGSIEAHLPGGPVRFASIDALRDHLDKGG